ncbi:MAG: hypothetical protein IKG93_05605 [Clostridiales bacterium]|nr:hypothetical protein [Clostridiales bacterium]
MRLRKIKNGAMVIFLIACLMLASTGCAKKAKDFSFDTMEKIFQKHGAVQFGSFSEYEEDQEKDVPEDVLDKGYCNYIYCEGQEAQSIFENNITLSESPYKISRTLELEYGKTCTETSMDFVGISLYSFSSEKEAEDFFKENFDSDEDSQIRYDITRSGKKNGYRYTVRRTDGKGGAVFQYNDKMLHIVFHLGEAKNDLISDISKEFGIMNPLTA